jgi:Leucine-rich repeat (LRR) protein
LQQLTALQHLDFSENELSESYPGFIALEATRRVLAYLRGEIPNNRGESRDNF